jgi:hypothetical protein
VNALYRVVGVGPDGQREVGVARPRDEALRIFNAVLANRGADFGPYAAVRLLVEPVASTR